MLAEEGSADILAQKFILSLFELLKVEFKEITKYKRIECLYIQDIPQGLFLMRTRNTCVICTFIPFLSNQSVPCRLASQCETMVISKTQCKSNNGSFTEVYKRKSLSKNKQRKNIIKK